MSNSARNAEQRGSGTSVHWPDLTLPPINLHNVPILDSVRKNRPDKPVGQ